MKIAIVTDGLYPWVTGGMQMHSYYLVKYLSENNTIDVYHINPEKKLIDLKFFFPDEVLVKINFIELPFLDIGFLPGHYVRANFRYSKLVLNEILKRQTPELIICKGFTAYQLVQEKSNGVKLPPICVNFHGFEMFQQSFGILNNFKSLLLARYVKKICKLSDYVFSYGGKISQIIKERINISDEKILEFPSGIERVNGEFINKDFRSPRKFLFIGRYEPRKGIKELNSALKMMLHRDDWSIEFIGPIPDKDQIKDVKIKYHGLIQDKKKIFKIISEIDILICPSWSEGMPNVILEAMSYGVPAIGTDVGATSMLINEDTGWLLDNNDPVNLRNEIENVIQLSFLELGIIRQNCISHIRKSFLWKEIAKNIDFTLSQITSELKSKRK